MNISEVCIISIAISYIFGYMTRYFQDISELNELKARRREDENN